MSISLPAVDSIEAISITGGTAIGSDRLSTFDRALASAGIHNANLVRVSSISPTGIDRRTPDRTELIRSIEPGAFIPAVYARAESSTPGDTVYAAVAGVQLTDGYGVNVETHGTNTDNRTIRETCLQMLQELADTRDSEFAAEPWVHLERQEVPHTDAAESWAGAVAAILYRRN